MECQKNGVAKLIAQDMTPWDAGSGWIYAGIFLAVDENNETQVKEMREIAERWNKKVRIGHLNRFDAWLALTTMVMKRLEYPLMTTTLSEIDCTKIMAPI